jgi:hypothetical protein
MYNLSLLDDWDWEEAFKLQDKFKINEIKSILALHQGRNDEDNWIGIFQLECGLFACISAGCDYTGWG